MKPKVDYKRWRVKVATLTREYPLILDDILRFGNQKLDRAINFSLSGTVYYPGKLPVRKVSGTLKSAYQKKRINRFLYMHYMNHNIAPYDVFVHDGTRFMQPRPYFRTPVQMQKPAILNYWNYKFKLGIRKTGRA